MCVETPLRLECSEQGRFKMAVIGREIGSGATSTVHEPCRRGYHYFLRLDIALTPASRAEQKSINPVTSDSRWSRGKEGGGVPCVSQSCQYTVSELRNMFCTIKDLFFVEAPVLDPFQHMAAAYRDFL